ncbi:circularly permuted type 2 ATP-grasp protein [Salinicola avicenniae]|uniref:circularly permuted type 2 ATP-grasp protein n=1 Tax=Salinicola avicenniae TaxID=2916836 RepID=UPI0020732FB3|nr:MULTISPECIES: circularly permuted type 2 ATP-grasp protein [unclassified Salinicola]
MAAIETLSTPWLDAYRPAGGHDALLDGQGEVRQHWRLLLKALESLGHASLSSRADEIQHLLHDNGVTFNLPADESGSLRQWRLDPLPLLITPSEWRFLEQGLRQRSRLLAAVLKDIYGPRRMIDEGVLPADALYANPDFLLACDGLLLADDPGISLHGIDLTRDAEGRWRVLADHLQAPAGMGFALENRIVMARALPDLYRNAPLKRLAGFLDRQQQSLAALARLNRDQLSLALLAPGADHESYFEHAYLANYLNLALVEGGDLVVRDSRVWMRTLGGLKPVDVLLRQIGDAWSDPLELRGDSLIGVPGLLQAIRSGGVGITNPPGVGALEHPLIAAFLPDLCERLLGEPLLIEGVERHWCGRGDGLAWALGAFESLVFQRLDGDLQCIRPGTLDTEARERLRQALVAEPARYVASRVPAGASAPFLDRDCTTLLPSTYNLRCFTQAGFDDERNFHGYEAMPGGLAWQGAPGLAMQASQCVKDLWVMADSPQPHVSRLRRSRLPLVVTRDGMDLPSRVADSLLWMGRYGERLDGRLRLLREALYRLMDQDQEGIADETLIDLLPLLGLDRDDETGATSRFAADRERLMTLFQDGHPDALPDLIGRMINNGRAVRDHLGDDAWRVFNQLRQESARLSQLGPVGGRRAVDTLMTQLAAFFGFCNETMPHHYGWRFMDIGRFLERAQATLALLRFALLDAAHAGEALWEVVLSSSDNATAYRRRYRSELHPAAILDLLLFDEGNPRSVGYMFKRLERQIEHLPQPNDTPYRSSEARLLIRARAALHLADLEALAQVEEPAARAALAALLEALEVPLAELSQAIENSHFSHAEVPRQLVPMQAQGDA